MLQGTELARTRVLGRTTDGQSKYATGILLEPFRWGGPFPCVARHSETRKSVINRRAVKSEAKVKQARFTFWKTA